MNLKSRLSLHANHDVAAPSGAGPRAEALIPRSPKARLFQA